MDKSPKKSPIKDTSVPSKKPGVLPKPKDLYKKGPNTVATKDKKNTKTEFVNNSDDEILGKRERSLSDGSVKSLSWVCSEPTEENAPAHLPAKRTRSNTTNKEFWVLPKSEAEKMPKSQQKDDKKPPQSPEPVKPPRPKRENSFKRDQKDDKNMSTGGVKSKPKSPERDPIKPPRRKLPQPPKTNPEEQKQGKKKDKKDEEQRDVVSRPVVTSTPFQESMTLAVEDEDSNGRRVLSLYDEATNTTVEHGTSFYDFLYSDEGSSQAGALSGSQIRDLTDDNIYDDVPLESSTQSLDSVGKRTSSTSFGIYDEVIINKEHYMMPVDNTEELSDWGSDFDDDDDDFEEIDGDDAHYHIKVDEPAKSDGDDGDSSGSGSYEEYKNSSATFYSEERDSPSPQRRAALKLRNDSSASGKKANLHVHLPGLKGIKGCFGINKAPSLPYLANRKSKTVEQEPEEEPEYVDPNIADRENYQQPVMPDMAQGLTKVQVKRHQIVKFILESEADYMKLLDKLIKKYELPIRERDLLEPNKIDAIFQGIHKVLDCHVMFNIALSARMDEWSTEEKIGDILYALFCKSMVLEAYSSYVNNFAKAMDTIRSACKTHLGFAQLLKARRQSCRERTTLHSLMLKPTKRFPQFIDLVQELLKVTPFKHPDRIPLQMALTQLEYLADNLNERKREAELRQRVKQLDASTAHISKPLSAGNRYFIRQDDFVQCVIQEDTIVHTKRQRIIMLSDMLLCVSAIKGKKDRMTNFITDVKAKYKLKWNVPLSDVEVIEYGPGINLPYALPQGANKTTPRPGQHTGCQEHFADLQHDLAVIGQIAGLVATLRRSYQIVDNDKVQKWHKAVQRTIEEESRLANMYWLELSLPAKSGRVNYIFSTDSPSVKAEWLTALSTAVLRLAPENNPGWYLPEDNGTGEVSIQRRNMPLLKDNLDLFLLNPKARVQEIVTCPDVTNPLPGIHDNYNNLWLLCGGPDSKGFISVIRVSCSSPPQIVESFHVCDSQILCGEFVVRTCLEDKKVTGPLSGKFGFPFPTVWLGTQSGKIYIYNGADSERRYVMSVKLPDSVLDLKSVKRKVFASLGDGSLVVFKPNKDGIWDFSKPKAIGLSKLPVVCMAVVAGTLWCGSGNNIHIFDYKKDTVKHVIEVDPNVKTTVRHLVCYGIGVWVSLWKQPTIKLYHSETREHVQDMNIAYTVNTMQNDIDSQFEKTKLNKLYVSCMDAEEGLLWVGTSVGLVLIFPLPRLEGIPLVSGRACVSFHAYQGRVRSLCPLKNNPDAEVAIGPPSTNKRRYQLFREHVTRDACVQTDPTICRTNYAANGPEPVSKASTTKSTRIGQDDEDEVHSDEEFSFVDERPDYIPTGRSSSNLGEVSVRITTGQGGAGQRGAGQGVASQGTNNTTNGLANKVPDLGDTDFVKMMESFQGFGSSPSIPLPDPPNVSAAFVSNDLKDKETGDEKPIKQDINGKEKAPGGEIPADELEQSNRAINSDTKTEKQGGDKDGTRGRMASQGTYVKLQDAVEEARMIGEAIDATNTDDVILEMTSSTDNNQTGNDVYSPPSYVQVLGSPSPKVFSDSDNDNNGESFSAFSTSVSGGAQSPDGVDKKKVANLQSRLPFPVLLVTAGEGHADLRRKKPDMKSNDPRIMIWQIN